MAKKKTLHNVPALITFGVFIFIAVTTLIISGNFADIPTPFGNLSSIFAGRAQPRLTEAYTDNFNTGSVDSTKWDTVVRGSTNVAVSGTDKLRIQVPEGAVEGKRQRGALVFKETIEEKGDFRILVVVQRPRVTGDGTGVAGIKFSSSGNDDDEGATIQWRVNGASSKAVFIVRAADGTVMESQEVDVVANVAILRLDRVNKRYTAYYKLGDDLTNDTRYQQIGEERAATLGNQGVVSLFAHNSGAAGKFPAVLARFDTARVRWQGGAATHIGFNDSFANGVVGAKWTENRTAGTVIRENANNNLSMRLEAGSAGTRSRHAYLVRNEPTIPQGKDFRLTAVVRKPSVTGSGRGYSGLRFVSAGNTDDEGAMVRWVVGNNVNQLVFTVRAPDGSQAEKARVDVAANVNQLTMRLDRKGNIYSGWYRIGDGDESYIKIGEAESANFGANGKVSLTSNNMGNGGNYPAVVSRFDHVNGSIQK